MIHSRLGSCLGAALVVGLLSLLLESPARPAPLPKERPTLRLTPAGEMKVADLAVWSAAVIDENTVVLVGTKQGTDEDDPYKLDPNGAIVDLAKKTSRPFTNGHTAGIFSVSVSRGRLVTASNYRDPVLRVWDLKANKALAAIEIDKPDDSNFRYGVACFHKSDRIAVTAVQRVFVLDPARPDERTEFACPEGSARWVDKVRVSADDAWLAAAGEYDHLVLWEVANRKATALSLLPKGAKPPGGPGGSGWRIMDLAFGPTGTLFATRSGSESEVPEGKAEKDVPAEQRGVVRIDLPSGDRHPLAMGHTIDTWSCATDASGMWLATGGKSHPQPPRPNSTSDGELRVYHLLSGELVYREQPKDSPLTWVAFTPSGKRVVAAYDGMVRWWDVTAR